MEREKYDWVKVTTNSAQQALLRASLVAQLVKDLPAMWEPGFDPWVGTILWRRERLPTPVFWPGEFHGLFSSWGHKELDMTEQLSQESQAGIKITKRNINSLRYADDTTLMAESEEELKSLLMKVREESEKGG